jgi:enoyl-CoA hydratase/carnithine racemase
MTCDLIVAGESARFGQPEVKIGIIPGGGATQRLTRAVGKYKAMKYILVGEPISAREAFEAGLASEVVPDPEVEGRAIDLARQIAALPPLAIQLAKEAVLAGMDAPMTSALALEVKSLQILFSSHDQKEGMRAFIEKRKPRFTGH